MRSQKLFQRINTRQWSQVSVSKCNVNLILAATQNTWALMEFYKTQTTETEATTNSSLQHEPLHNFALLGWKILFILLHFFSTQNVFLRVKNLFVDDFGVLFHSFLWKLHFSY